MMGDLTNIYIHLTYKYIYIYIYIYILSWLKFVATFQPCSAETAIQSAKTRPGADYGSDHELLITNSDLN